MNIIDVTLRDGGHIVDFNWPSDFLSSYLPTVSAVKEINYVELGYWSQTAKSQNRFYNMNAVDLENIVDLGLSKKASIMIDFHYCSKNIDHYKSEGFEKNVGLIRLCSRREDIQEAVVFGKKLIDELGVELSLNFFNITNYNSGEIAYCIENGEKAGATFLYFADTHGALNLHKEGVRYGEYARMITDSGMLPGLHLHDHSGKAYLNYCLGQDLGFKSFDCSLGGMGKGVGNLRMEHVVNCLSNLDLMDLLESESILRMPPLVNGIVTSALSATDYYATAGTTLGLAPSAVAKALQGRTSTERDVFNRKILENITK